MVVTTIVQHLEQTWSHLYWCHSCLSCSNVGCKEPAPTNPTHDLPPPLPPRPTPTTPTPDLPPPLPPPTCHHHSHPVRPWMAQNVPRCVIYPVLMPMFSFLQYWGCHKTTLPWTKPPGPLKITQSTPPVGLWTASWIPSHMSVPMGHSWQWT